MSKLRRSGQFRQIARGMNEYALIQSSDVVSLLERSRGVGERGGSDERRGGSEE